MDSNDVNFSPFGKPGEAVPQVDADDVKTVWDYAEETQKTTPGCVISVNIFEMLCKPGADVRAVCYRVSLLELALQFAKEQLAPWSLDSLLRAIATAPMEWMEVGVVRDGLPFDFEEFLKLCNEK